MNRVILFLFLLCIAVACGKDAANLPIDSGKNPDTSTTIDASKDILDEDTPHSASLTSSRIIHEEKGLDVKNSQSGLFDFVVPMGTQSVVIMISGKESEFYTISSWKNGDRTDLVPENWARTSSTAAKLCLVCDNRITSSESIGTAFVPNNQNVNIKPGVHTASIFAYRQSGGQVSVLPSTKVDVVVYAHRFDEMPFARLSLNLHFTGAAGLTADSAKTSPDFLAEIEVLKDIYSQAKIEIDRITYTDIDSTYQIIENVLAPNSDLQKMFKLGKATTVLTDGESGGLNIFFVDEILLESSGGFGIVLGFSGGIPGPIIGGTARSGVAISMKDQISATPPGFVIAHEIGHHLGLFHTTELPRATSQVHDQISDTPINDSSMLMHFSGQNRTLSPNQIRVMRLNPWLNY